MKKRKTHYRRNPIPVEPKVVPDVDGAHLFFEMILDFLGSLPGVEPSRPAVRVELETMWRKLMLLCHPDKHGNSELSQEVTRWLIENRPK